MSIITESASRAAAYGVGQGTDAGTAIGDSPLPTAGAPCPIMPRHLSALRALRSAAIASTNRRGLSARQLLIWQEIETAHDCLDDCANGMGWLIPGSNGRPLAFGVVRPGRLPHLAGLFVDPAAQGRGLGSLLLHLLETRLRMRGARQIAASANAASAGFFLRHGYSTGFAAHFRGLRHDPMQVLTFLQMNKPLVPPPPRGTGGARRADRRRS